MLLQPLGPWRTYGTVRSGGVLIFGFWPKATLDGRHVRGVGGSFRLLVQLRGLRRYTLRGTAALLVDLGVWVIVGRFSYV